MIYSKKNIVFASFLIFLVLISGCRGKKDVNKSIEELRTGANGIIINFLPNNPPEIVYADKTKKSFDVILELNNKGIYPQPEERLGGPNGRVFLSGYDPNIIKLEAKDSTDDLSKRALEGKSLINLNGGSDISIFTGTVDYDKLNVEKYDLTLLATACYEYESIAEQSVCIDPNPYSTIDEKKVCEVKDISLSGQGAPVAVVKIDEEALQQKTQFRITIKNVGNGDVIKLESKEKCNPSGTERLGREDVDKVFVKEVKISNVQLECRPFAEASVAGTSGYIRLINGEGSIICELSKDVYPNYKTSKFVFTTPLTIHLSYFYRNTAERKLQIKKEASLTNK